jgi:hypothetical protein
MGTATARNGATRYRMPYRGGRQPGQKFRTRVDTKRRFGRLIPECSGASLKQHRFPAIYVSDFFTLPPFLARLQIAVLAPMSVGLP